VQYVEFYAQYNATRMATMISHYGNEHTTRLGTVIFTRAARQDIATLADLKGKSLIAASRTAFAS